MITVGMNYIVKPGMQAQFERKFDVVLEAVRAADGHAQSSLYRDVHDEAAYLIVSEWSSQDRFVQFIRSQAFKDVTAWGKADILAGRPQHTIYKRDNVVEHR